MTRESRASGPCALDAGLWHGCSLLRTDCMRTGCGVAGLLSSCGECGERKCGVAQATTTHIYITQDTELGRTALAPSPIMSPIWPRQPANLLAEQDQEHGADATSSAGPAAGSPRASFMGVTVRLDTVGSPGRAARAMLTRYVRFLSGTLYRLHCSKVDSMLLGPRGLGRALSDSVASGTG